MSKNAASADIVIFGGGVAGLWLLNRVRQAGFSAILFESGALGGGQTTKSQGIIHGGMKYALQGVLTNDAKAMADMPERWKNCLAGKGEIDLSHVPILSSQHYLWSPNKFTSKLTGFLASATLTSEVKSIAKQDYPVVFQNPKFRGEVFSLGEIVIDVPALVRELVKHNQDCIFKIEPLSEDALQLNEQGELQSATVYHAGKSLKISARQFIFTAGSGNEVIIHKLKHPDVAMQRRPLHMVMAKLPFNSPLYAHCLGLGSRPRITVTTHYANDGSSIWYLGGSLAEEGVDRDSATQIQAARKELASLFPWVNFSDAQFASFMIDRAEPKQKSGFKPDSSVIKQVKNMLIAWPTKLALAPKLADDILNQLQAQSRAPQCSDLHALRAWPIPPLAAPIWEELF